MGLRIKQPWWLKTQGIVTLIAVFALAIQPIGGFVSGLVANAVADTINPEISKIDAYYNVQSTYTSVTVDFTVDQIPDANSIEVRVNSANGDHYSITGKQGVIDSIKNDNPVKLSAPVVMTGSRTSNSWTNQIGTWTGSEAPKSVDVIITRDNGLPVTKTDDTIGENIATWAQIYETVPRITNVYAYYRAESAYTAISVDFSTKNISNADDIELRANRAGGETYSVHATPSLVSTLNTAADPTSTTGLIVIAGSRDSGSWTNQTGKWVGSEAPVSVDVIITLTNGNVLKFSDDTIGENKATWSSVNVDMTSPDTSLNIPTAPVGKEFTISGFATDDTKLSRVFIQLNSKQYGGRYGQTTIHLSGTEKEWSKTYNSQNLGLRDGDYRAHVSVTDAKGNTKKIGWSDYFTVDNEAPVSSNVTLEGEEITENTTEANGVIPGNFYKVNNQINFSVDFEDSNSGIDKVRYVVREILPNGYSQQSTLGYGYKNMANIEGSNTWTGSFDTKDVVDETKNYVVLIVGYDKAGNRSERNIGIKIDNTAPLAPSSLLVNGLEGPFYTKSDTRFNRTWKASESSDVVKYIYKSFTTKERAENPAFGGFTKEFEAVPGQDYSLPGTTGHTFWWVVGAVDATGNTTWSPIYNVIQDDTAPDTIDAVYSPSKTGLTNGDKTVTITTSEPVLNPGDGWKGEDGSTVFEKTFTKNGEFYVHLEDLAGNKATVGGKHKPYEYEIKGIDKAAPEVSGIADGEYTNADSVTLSASDLSKDGYSKGISDTDWLTVNGTKIKTNSLNYTISDEGHYNIVVNDKAGNSTSLSFTIDRTAPKAEITTEIKGPVKDTIAINGKVDSDIDRYYLSIRDSDGNVVTMKNGKSAQNGTKYKNTVDTWNFDTNNLVDGRYRIQLDVIDKAGNKNETPSENGDTSVAIKYFTVDNTDPSAPDIIPSNTTTAKGSFKIKVTPVGDGDSIESTTVTDSLENLYTVYATSGNSRTYTIDTSILPKGTKIFVTATSRDAAGNISPVPSNATYIVDNGAPAVEITSLRDSGDGIFVLSGTSGFGPGAEVTARQGSNIHTSERGTLADGSWSVVVGELEAETTYTFYVTIRNNLGYFNNPPAMFSHTTDPVRGSGVDGVATASAVFIPGETQPVEIAGDTVSEPTVLGSEDSRVQGDATKKPAAIAPSQEGWKLFGTAWYWWLAALAAIGAFLWWLASAIRRRQTQEI